MTEQTHNLPKWDIDQSHPDLVEQLRDELRYVKDPEIGMDIIQLGMVRNVSVSDDQAEITMILTTPYCPYGPMLLESARKRAEKIIQKKTVVQYGKEVWNQTMMEDTTAFDWGIF